MPVIIPYQPTQALRDMGSFKIQLVPFALRFVRHQPLTLALDSLMDLRERYGGYSLVASF